MIDWDEAFEEKAKQTAHMKTDLEKARIKSEGEFQRGVRNGWWTVDGEPIPQLGDDEGDEDDEVETH